MAQNVEHFVKKKQAIEIFSWPLYYYEKTDTGCDCETSNADLEKTNSTNCKELNFFDHICQICKFSN